MSSGIEQKIIQAMKQLIVTTKLSGWTPISPGIDPAYEAGRRIGIVQGMTLAQEHIDKTLADSESDDKDL
jgi:hypothetical protein